MPGTVITLWLPLLRHKIPDDPACFSPYETSFCYDLRTLREGERKSHKKGARKRRRRQVGKRKAARKHFIAENRRNGQGKLKGTKTGSKGMYGKWRKILIGSIKQETKVDFLDFEQFSNSRKNTSGKENESWRNWENLK